MPLIKFSSIALPTRNTFCKTWYLPHSQVHNDRAVVIMVGWNKSNFIGDLSIVHVQRILRTELYIASGRFMSRTPAGVPRPDFLKDVKISAIRVHLRQIWDYIIFAWVFRTSWPKMEDWGDKIGEGVVRYWPLELVLPFGGSYVCANFGENR